MQFLQLIVPVGQLFSVIFGKIILMLQSQHNSPFLNFSDTSSKQITRNGLKLSSPN